jgi:integrase
MGYQAYMALIEERRTKDGIIKYRVQIRLKGFPTTTATFERKTDAKRWAQQTEAEMRTGRYFKTVESKKHTVQELIERYEANILPQRGRDMKTVKGELTWWKEQLGPYLLADITPQFIAEFRDKLAKEPIKVNESIKANKPKDLKAPKKPLRYRTPATIIRYLASLSVCFSYAIEDLAWIDANPVLKVRKPSLDNDRVRFLSEDESKKLLAACKRCGYKPMHSIVVIALSTGARQGEIMNLCWKDIDLNQKVMRLEETKNGERRSVPLSSHALTIIQELKKVRRIDTTLLFPRADGQKPFEIKKYWKKAIEEAAIENFRFHDLRHTAASNLAMSGATLLEIADILGHKQLKMVKRYAHLTKQHTATVLERMNDRQFA